jgi:hypothetical protein
VLGLPLPAYEEVRIEESDFTQVTPTEFRADLVVTLLQDEVPMMGTVVEVQRRMDPRKPYTWLVYVATERARIEKPVALLVITDDAEVANWARKPIEFGPRSVLSAIVLGPGEVPWIRTEEEASRRPELAVLSALAHGNEPGGREVALAVLKALGALDAERGGIYYDLVLGSFDEEIRRALEQELQMQPRKYEYKTEFARSYYAKGEAKGHAEGEAKGRAEGKAEGEAKALLAVLAARGLEVDAATRERILTCTDAEKLERWIVRAVTASSAQEVLSDL